HAVQTLVRTITKYEIKIRHSRCNSDRPRSGAEARINDRTMKPKSKPVHPEVRIGHIHLKVADLDRALAFYRDVLGFEVTQRLGQQAAFLSAGGYHHHIGLNTWESQGGSAP